MKLTPFAPFPRIPRLIAKALFTPPYNPSITDYMPFLLRLTLALLFATGPLFAAVPIQIMPLGDSITKGAVDPGPSYSGYRARLFDLLNEAKVNYLFVGCTDTNSNDAMKAAGQQFHNGYGSWRIDGLLANFEADKQQRGDDNMGGYFMGGGTGALRQPVFPDIVLLLAGTNDLGQGANESVMETRMTDLLAWFQKNRPKSLLFVATVPPRGPSRSDFVPYNTRVDTFNAWLAKKVASLGSRFQLVDIHALFIDAAGKVKADTSPDGIFLKDGIHPSHNGYVAMGDLWFNAIKPSLSSAR